jgi:hypothetical protein
MRIVQQQQQQWCEAGWQQACQLSQQLLALLAALRGLVAACEAHNIRMNQQQQQQQQCAACYLRLALLVSYT